MIRFACKPDEIFTQIVTRMLEEAIYMLDEDINGDIVNYADGYFEDDIIKAFGGGLSGVNLIKAELEKLLKAHKSEYVFMPTDRHFQLLDRILRNFCDLYTDLNSDILPKDFKKYGSEIFRQKRKPIIELDAGMIMDYFFWDNDYDLSLETASAMTKPQYKFIRNMGDFSNEAIGASLYLPVDASDLRIKKTEPPETWNEDAEFPWIRENDEEEQ